MPVTASSRLLWWLSLVPAILTFLLLTVFLTSSMVQGVLFTGGVAVTMLFFGIIGRLLLTWCKHLSNTFHGLPKIALRNLYRNRFPSLSIFITIATGVFLINLIPQLQKGLEQEFSHPIGLKIPIFFLVDIQEEQINGLQDFFKQQPSHLSNISPMVRGRIRSINGTSFHQRRIEADQEGRGSLRRTEFNFSSRDELDPSETVIEGKELSTSTWSFQSGIPFEISVAQRFSKRYDLQLGDRIVFDIQGIEVEGMVANIRKVRWNSFQPNFFLLFQKGVLENAPKTYLASISQVSQTDKQPLKEQIVNRFPNISVIDVASTITSIIELTERLIFAIKSIALLAIGAGLMALYSIAGNEAFRHAPEINLLKVLGTRFSDIRLLTVLQFGLLGCTAGVFSVFISTSLSYVVSWYFFDRIWGLDMFSSIWIVLCTTLTCIFTAALATRSVIRQNPVTLLH
jgi:putative ABC transport system permease protein